MPAAAAAQSCGKGGVEWKQKRLLAPEDPETVTQAATSSIGAVAMMSNTCQERDVAVGCCLVKGGVDASDDKGGVNGGVKAVVEQIPHEV